MRKIDTNNHFIDKSDLDHIKNRLHLLSLMRIWRS